MRYHFEYLLGSFKFYEVDGRDLLFFQWFNPPHRVGGEGPFYDIATTDAVLGNMAVVSAALPNLRQLSIFSTERKDGSAVEANIFYNKILLSPETCDIQLLFLTKYRIKSQARFQHVVEE